MSNTEENTIPSQQEEKLRLEKAYRAVFGLEGKRTPAQKLVLADIEHQGRIWRNTHIPNKEGKMCALKAAVAEGERIFAIRIIQLANTKPGEDPKTVKVKKGNR